MDPWTQVATWACLIVRQSHFDLIQGGADYAQGCCCSYCMRSSVWVCLAKRPCCMFPLTVCPTCSYWGPGTAKAAEGAVLFSSCFRNGFVARRPASKYPTISTQVVYSWAAHAYLGRAVHVIRSMFVHGDTRPPSSLTSFKPCPVSRYSCGPVRSPQLPTLCSLAHVSPALLNNGVCTGTSMRQSCSSPPIPPIRQVHSVVLPPSRRLQELERVVVAVLKVEGWGRCCVDPGRWNGGAREYLVAGLLQPRAGVASSV